MQKTLGRIQSVNSHLPAMSETLTSDQALVVPLRDKPLKLLNRIAKKPPLDIEFQDLTYSVRDANVGGRRQILKSVNGNFRSGELTAILGPSGAGKSTLLNILAGYVTTGVQGSIKVNGRPREMKIFKKLSSYIMQEDIVQPRLTVTEAMTYSANLKLGGHVTQQDKLAVVTEVINLLGLQSCADTRSEYLSGGQRKRLNIALELVNNPPVIFLDEPTSGLDNYAIKQCMDLLQKISQLGRTVICTIHQPPASLFQSFSQVYIVANGACVYNGSPSQLVPFMSLSGFECPQYNTPADYMMELVYGTPETVRSFSAAIQNGKINRTDHKMARISEVFDDDVDVIYQETTQAVIQKSDIVFPTSFLMQFQLLLHRIYVQTKRNQIGLYIQFFHHLLSAVIIGGIFFGIGNDATQTIAIFKYCVSCNVFFMYTHVMLPVLLFPMEIKLMKREYFNRWYSLKAYYAALSVATLPLLILLGMMFSCIVYFMTGQPMEIDRFIGFCLMGLTISVTSQGLGYALGAVFSITNGSIVGPSVLAPLLALAVYGMGYKSAIEPFMNFLMSLTFLRYGIVGFCNAIFYNRDKLICPEEELYCHYANPQMLMADMAMPSMPYQYQLGYILIFLVLFRVVGYLTLKFRLNSELSSKIVYIASKVVKHKYFQD